jgi:anti-sigma regulatory factor (Ser/Thr protein kinase)
MADGPASAAPPALDPAHPENVVTLNLAATPVSVGVARGQVAAICQREGLPDLRDTATLLVSELVTNAIMHGAGQVTLSVACIDQELTIGVSDESPAAPEVDRNPPTDRPGGRGLFLVESLATHWDYVRLPGGKLVWFSLNGNTAGDNADAPRPAHSKR